MASIWSGVAVAGDGSDAGILVFAIVGFVCVGLWTIFCESWGGVVVEAMLTGAVPLAPGDVILGIWYRTRNVAICAVCLASIKKRLKGCIGTMICGGG